MRKQVFVVGGIQPFAEEVAHVSQADEDQIAEVRGNDDVVRRLVLDVIPDILARRMGRRMPILLVRAMAKFGVHGGEDLLGIRWDAREA